jgi:anti-sigma regulatory factor (Ser/Thr protein kinase)
MSFTVSPGIIAGVRIRLAGSQPLHSPALGQVLAGNPGVVFDAGDMGFASPLDLAGITAWAAQLRHEGACVGFVLPDDGDVRRYLVRMDLIEHLDQAGVTVSGPAPTVRRADRTDVLLEVRRICGSADAERFAVDVYQLAQRHTSDSSAAAGAKMLGELLDNAITHAASPVGVYAAAQVHQRGGDLELAVADAGIGIRSHLARNPRFMDLTATEALRAALRPGVTGTSERRGNGLPDLLSTASGFGGQLLLRSDDGYAQVMAASSDRKFAAAGQVPGTWAWVHVRLPHQQRRMVSLQQ